MLIAIMILAALFFMALPFAAYMRQQHSSATQALEMARARYGQSGAVAHAKNVLYNNYRKQTLAAGTLPFPWNVPDVDTAYNFHVMLRTTDTTGPIAAGSVAASFDVADALGWPNDGDATTVDGYIRVGDEWMGYSDITGLDDGATPPRARRQLPRGHGGRQRQRDGVCSAPQAVAHNGGDIVSFFPSSSLWSLDIQDQQAKINVNTAPYLVILNLIQYLGIGGDPPGPLAPSRPTRPASASRHLAQAIVGYKTYATIWRGGTALAYTPYESVDMVKNCSVATWFSVAVPPLLGGRVR